MNYSENKSDEYSKIGVSETSYEASFECASKILSKLSPKTVVDFGCGTGRSITFLKNIGLNVVAGIDRDKNMLNIAKQLHSELPFYRSLQPLLKKGIQVDLVFSSHVISEIKSQTKLFHTLKKISQIIRPHGYLLIITINPESIGLDYVSFQHALISDKLDSGAILKCLIKSNKPFEVDDYFWSVSDLKGAFLQTGFKLLESHTPLSHGDNWLNETSVAPHIVYLVRKHNF